MTLSLIVAASRNNVIGSEGGLPWHLPDDLGHFKRLTTGKPVIMGRRTFESIGRPLPDRRNIVMTRQADYPATGCEVVSSVDEALSLVHGTDEVMIIGGGQVYRDFLPHADRIYVTRVQDEAAWQLVRSQHHAADDRHAYEFDLLVFERRPG
jgi:dihydrofolate reductase